MVVNMIEKVVNLCLSCGEKDSEGRDSLNASGLLILS
jgi:hypothetical protein